MTRGTRRDVIAGKFQRRNAGFGSLYDETRVVDVRIGCSFRIDRLLEVLHREESLIGERWREREKRKIRSAARKDRASPSDQVSFSAKGDENRRLTDDTTLDRTRWRFQLGLAFRSRGELLCISNPRKAGKLFVTDGRFSRLRRNAPWKGNGLSFGQPPNHPLCSLPTPTWTTLFFRVSWSIDTDCSV